MNLYLIDGFLLDPLLKYIDIETNAYGALPSKELARNIFVKKHHMFENFLCTWGQHPDMDFIWCGSTGEEVLVATVILARFDFLQDRVGPCFILLPIGPIFVCIIV